MWKSDPHSEDSRYGHAFLAGLLGNLALAAWKISFALLGYSGLVLVDGLFSLMTATAFLLPWQAASSEKRAPDGNHPYGWTKLVFVAMSVVGFLGLIIAVHMSYYGLKMMGWAGTYLFHSRAVLLTVVSIVVNELLYRYYADAKKGHSALTRWCAHNNRIGVWVSSVVLFFLILDGLGIRHLERVGVVVVSIIVFFMSVRMLLAGFAGIMDKAPPQEILNQARSCARTVNEVKDVARIRARRAGTLLDIELWITVDEHVSIENASGIARDVERRLIERIPSAREVEVIIS